MAVLMPRSVPQRVRVAPPPPDAPLTVDGPGQPGSGAVAGRRGGGGAAPAPRRPAGARRRRSILAPGAPHGEARIRCVRRRFGLALGLLLAGLALLVAGPFDLGAVRVAGVSLLWWYGGAVAPVLAALLTLALVPSGRSPRR